jgi:hypothetical protein
MKNPSNIFYIYTNPDINIHTDDYKYWLDCSKDIDKTSYRLFSDNENEYIKSYNLNLYQIRTKLFKKYL